MPRVRILVLVMTYPTLSRRYGQTVCTAGLTEDGQWVRLYPVPYPRLPADSQFQKYDWIETTIQPSTSDPRPETHTVVEPTAIRRVPAAASNQEAIHAFVLRHCPVYEELTPLIDGAHNNTISLALFRPTRVPTLTYKEGDRSWDPKKLHQIAADARQADAFESNWRLNPTPIPKLPYKFIYEFQEKSRDTHHVQAFDWDIGTAYWAHLRSLEATGFPSEEGACGRTVCQFHDHLMHRADLHFFLGTTFNFSRRAPNPWVIVGLFPVTKSQPPDHAPP